MRESESKATAFGIILDTQMKDNRVADKSPDAFRTISEVAESLDLPQHVLRFWETRFNQIKPMKRGGGRRYYRPDDVQLLKGIRFLLYSEGYTIKGVQRILREQGNKFVMVASEGSFALAALSTSKTPHSTTPTVADLDAGGLIKPSTGMLGKLVGGRASSKVMQKILWVRRHQFPAMIFRRSMPH